MVRLGDRVTARRAGFSPRAGRVSRIERSPARPTVYVVTWSTGRASYWARELSPERLSR